jgi:tetratricopeptide (TPR) repeat protein
MVNRLVTYRILRHDAASQTYTAHPLVRNHYFALFTKGSASQEKAAHEQIKDYYLSIAGDTPQYPALDDLKPLIEVVHHACEAGAYDEARDIYWERISQREKRVLTHQLGAQGTDLNIMLEFFPNNDSSKEPQTSKSDYNRFILNEIGLCLMNLGRLREAVPFYESKNAIALEMQDWHNLSLGYINLAELHASPAARGRISGMREFLLLGKVGRLIYEVIRQQRLRLFHKQKHCIAKWNHPLTYTANLVFNTPTTCAAPVNPIMPAA